MEFGSENILPYNEEEGKGAQVERMFDSIAGAYDRLNHILSLGLDKGWRRKGIESLVSYAPSTILDVATGTGDLAIAMQQVLHPERITGIDISEGMMDIGREKVRAEGFSKQITFEWQDSLSLTYEDNRFEAVTAAFGVRNFADIRQGLSEMYRVMAPGGRLMILELTTPEYFPMKQLFAIYSKLVIPTVGRFFSKQKSAYTYLPDSIKVVPQGKVMLKLLREVGFKEVDVKLFTCGICSLYTGAK